jgi:hypothetical protein
MAACTAALLSAGMLSAQTANQSSAQSPYYGSVTIVQPTDGVKPLTIDQAIGMGIEHNLALVEARQQEQSAKAQTSKACNLFCLPSPPRLIRAHTRSTWQPWDFPASLFLKEIAPLFPA